MSALPEPINVGLYDFARAFRFGDNPIFNFRVLPPKFNDLRKMTDEDKAQFAGAKVPYFAWLQSMCAPYGVDSRPFKEDLALELLKDPKNPTLRKISRTNAGADARAAYFVVNQGGQKKENIEKFTAFFGEWDDCSLEEQCAKVMSFAIPPHIIIRTRSSLHCYWLAVEPTTAAEWEAVQRTFIVANNSDPAIKDLPRLMRLPGYDHTTFDFEIGQVSRVPVTCLKFDTGERLTAAQMFEMLAQAGQAEVSKAEFDAWLKTRNGTNKQRVRVRQERESKSDKSKPLYEGEPPADLKQVHSDICERVTIVAPAGDGVRAICPVCEDASPSLIITLTPEKILMVDHAGCTFAEICEAIPIKQEHCFARKKDEQDAADDGGPTIAQQLIALALVNSELFHDAGGDAYLTATVGGHRETYRLGSRDSKDWLAGLLYRKTGRAVSGDKIAEALTVLRAIARHDSPEIETHVRIAEHEGAIFADLCDKDWRQVKITENGWEIIASIDSPTRFVRAKGMLPLPEPARGGSTDELRELLNLPADDADTWPMILGWLVAAFRPCNGEGFDYPLLAIHGEQGSAKSSAQRILRDLIDPNKATLRAAPRDERDLAIAAAHGRIISCDNLTYISENLSNAFCRLATGGGFATRELFTDDGEVIFDAQRPVILNGIAEVVTRSDLLDRTLLAHLPVIEPGRRWRKRILNKKFAAVRPRILGALLDAVSAGLKRLDKGIDMDEWPRMSDFAEWVMACETALGLKDGAFIAAYRRNIASANGLAIDASLVAQAIIGLIDDSVDHGFEGTVGELLKVLDARNDANGTPKNKNDWPTTPEKLRAELKKLAPNLRRERIAIIFSDRSKHRRKMTITRLVRDQLPKLADCHQTNEINSLEAASLGGSLDFGESGTGADTQAETGGAQAGASPPSDGTADCHPDWQHVNHSKQKAGDSLPVLAVIPLLVDPAPKSEKRRRVSL